MAAAKEPKDRSLDRHKGTSVIFRTSEEEMAELKAAAEEANLEFAKWLREAAREKLSRQRRAKKK